jgi:nitrogen fixation NifU-like protein
MENATTVSAELPGREDTMVDREEMDGLDRLVAELQREIDERERELYSARVLEQARRPTNLGRMENPDVHAAVTGWCGDTMEIFLRFRGRKIQEATFLTDGCGPSVACGNMVTTMVRELSLAEAEALSPGEVILALDGLPDESVHCAELAVQALHQALGNAQPQGTREAK